MADSWKKKWIIVDGKILFGRACDNAGAESADLWNIPASGKVEFDFLSGRMVCLVSKAHSFDLKAASERNTISDLKKCRGFP